MKETLQNDQPGLGTILQSSPLILLSATKKPRVPWRSRKQEIFPFVRKLARQDHGQKKFGEILSSIPQVCRAKKKQRRNWEVPEK